MKKKSIYAALAAVMLLCSACGKQEGAPNNETITDEIVTDDKTEEPSGIAGEPTTDTGTNDGGTDADTSTDDGDEEPNDSEEQSISVSIEFQTVENRESAEDGTTIYTNVIVYPVVSIEGNEAAAEKINADIVSRVNTARIDTTVLDMAKEIYGYALEEGTEQSEYPFPGYSSDLDFTVTRADSSVISFVVTYREYSGGAHDNYGSIGVNYSPRTGELIDFTELSENADAFHAGTFAFIKEIAASESYQASFFTETSDETLESVLYAGEQWYFSTSGLVFTSDPYVLGPYSSGEITFTIPYRDLEEMGLKEEYRYAGNLTMKLNDGDSYTMDINGDGNEDTIELYTSYDENENQAGEFFPHLIINGVDVAQGYNEELSGILVPWPEVALYDMSAEDDTIEIAIILTQTNEATGTADAVSTYFFRYEKDGSVNSAGMTRGNAAAPAYITAMTHYENNAISAKDGAILYKSSCIYPVISIEDNDAAAEKINADIRARLDAFYADAQVREQAEESYRLYAEDKEHDDSYVEFQEDLWISAVRSDSNVISIVLDRYTYSGGAHGSTNYSAINYSAKTGEPIAFSDLGEDADKFYVDTLAYNLELAMTDDYQARFFDFDSLEETLESVLYKAENKWYLTPDGLTFIANEYELGAYVYGRIDFLIPYSELEKIGLKEEYRYKGDGSVSSPSA